MGSHALGAHGDAAAAVAVPANHHVQSGKKQVGGTENAVDGGLAGAVAVVEKVLGVGVVHRNDGIFEHAVISHAAQPDDARGGFFRSADDARHQFLPLAQDGGDKVGAVVHGDLGFVVQSR